MKKLLCVITSLALLGCQAHTSNKERAEPKYPTALEIKSQCELQTATQVVDRDTKLWICQAVTAIQYRFFDADKYRGKTCDLLITQPRGEPPLNAVAIGGDPALCAVALEAIKQAVNANTFPLRLDDMKDTISIRFIPQ